jgi:hypothetical protein
MEGRGRSRSAGGASRCGGAETTRDTPGIDDRDRNEKDDNGFLNKLR